jgi:hypothetical protein
MGTTTWRWEKEERGDPGAAVGNVGWPETAPDRRARAAALPREQGRAAGVGNAGNGVSVADGQDRGEVGPGGSGRGAREKERERWGGGGVLTCGPGWHSARRRGLNWI